MRVVLLVALALLGGCRGADGAREPLVLAGDEVDWLAAFDCTDPAAWTQGERDGAGCLELVGPSDYAPPHRSPLSIALLRDVVAGDFDLDVELMQTGREYGHRDLCLFFGWTDPAHFYYVHLASAPDDHAHNVFLVDGADRRRLADVSPTGVAWGTDAWHGVHLERRLADGAIRVTFDGAPVFELRDTTLGAGRVGVGSFDDVGAFRALRLRRL